LTYAYIVHLADYSDGVLYILAALLLIALAVMTFLGGGMQFIASLFY